MLPRDFSKCNIPVLVTLSEIIMYYSSMKQIHPDLNSGNLSTTCVLLKPRNYINTMCGHVVLYLITCFH